jgi:hypothetical protein
MPATAAKSDEIAACEEQIGIREIVAAALERTEIVRAKDGVILEGDERS